MPGRGRNRNVRVTRSNAANDLAIKKEKDEDDAVENKDLETELLGPESIKLEPIDTSLGADLSSASKRKSPSPYPKGLVAEYGSDEEENERTDRTKSEKLATAKKLASNDLRNFIPSGSKRKDNNASDDRSGTKYNNTEKNTSLDDDDFDDCMSIHADDEDSFLNETGDKDTGRSSSKSSRSSIFGMSNAKKRKLAAAGGNQKGSASGNVKGRLRRKSQPHTPHTPHPAHSKSALRTLPVRSNNRPGLLGEAPQPQINPTGLLLQNIFNAVLSTTNQEPEMRSPVNSIPPLLPNAIGSNHGSAKSNHASEQIACRNWLKSGTCRFGDTCRFVHATKDATASVISSSEGGWKQPSGTTPVYRKRTPLSSSSPLDSSNLTVPSLLKQVDACLGKKDIVEAWHILKQALSISRQDVPISFVESLLLSCSTEVAPEAVEICMEVFEAVGGLRHHFVVQDYECLIKCFCHAAQYESALQVAIHMKANEFQLSSELLDSFLYKIPGNVMSFLIFWPVMKTHWLKNARFLNYLLENVDDLDEILRYVTAKEWWDAYEMLGKVFNDLYPKCQGKFLYLLMNLADKEPFIDLLDRIDFADVIPASVVKTIISEADSPETVALVTKLAPKLTLEVLEQVDDQVWNLLLKKCCAGRLEHLMLAQQVHGTMTSLNIPLTLEGATHLLLLLCKTKSNKQLCELLPDIKYDVNEFPSELIQHISILLRNFEPKDSTNQYNHMMALLKIKAQIPEHIFRNVIQTMMGRNEFIPVVDLLKQCKESTSQLSFALLHSIVKSLEYNCPDVQPSIDVYTLMRRAYPNSKTSSVDASTDTLDLKPSSAPVTPVHPSFNSAHSMLSGQMREMERQPQITYASPFMQPPMMRDIRKPLQPPIAREIAKPPPAFGSPLQRNLCRYVATGRICNFGLKCRFSHDVSSANMPEPLPGIAQSQSAAFPSRVPPQRDHQTSVSNHTGELSSSKDNSPLPSPSTKHQSEDPIESAKDLNDFVTLIKRCGHDRPMDDLARIHAQMRKKDMHMVNLGVCKAFVVSLSNKQKVADNFESYVSLLNNMLPARRNPSELQVDTSLDAKDLLFIGNIGILLMQHCNQQQKHHDGYRILHVLHAHEVNYCELGKEYPRSVQLISHCEIAVIAITICIKVTPPQFVGALEVLRGANYALPIDGHSLSPSERADRHSAILNLVAMLIQSSHYEEAYEVLNKTNNKAGEVPGYLSDFKGYYDELIVRFSSSDIEKAIEIYRFLEQNSSTIEAQPLKSLINGLAAAGRTAYSRQLFYTACAKGFYQQTFNDREPLSINIIGQHTKTELLFVIERHLDSLRNHHMYGENSFHTSSWQANRATKVNLRIMFSATQLTMQQDLLELLSSDLNPPLTISGVDKQRIDVDMMSIKRWYLAVPPFTPDSSSKQSAGSTVNNSTTSTNNIFNGSSDFRGGTSSSTITPLPTSSDYRTGQSGNLHSTSNTSSQAQSSNFASRNSSSNPHTPRIQTAVEPIKLAIADRVTFYVKMALVEPEASNQVMNMLTRYFLRREQECNPELVLGPMVIDRANIFVDNFFKKHKTFRPDIATKL